MSQPSNNVLRRALAAALIIAALMSHPRAAAAAAPATARTDAAPRIGLALSGGGARGIAHVGVLKVLEEMRIPIHCVTGDQHGLDRRRHLRRRHIAGEARRTGPQGRLGAAFRDQPPRDEISMRRKVDDYKTLFAPEYGVKDGGLALPKGLIAGIDRVVLPHTCRAGDRRQ